MTLGNGTTKTSGAASLREELHRLYSLRPTLDTFAEEGIRLIISESGVMAAAIFTYIQRKDQLNPLIISGLDEAGMNEVRKGVGRAWDIPLRSIRNRRINVIADAHDNPFVPDGLKAISPDSLTIASIPFFHASTPVGVAVLFAEHPSTFTDQILRMLSLGLRVCGAAIKDLPKTGNDGSTIQFEDTSPTEGAGQPNLLRGLAALKSEMVRLTTALEESERQRAAEVAERVTAQSFLKAAQQRSERAEQELNELREKQKRIPELEQEGLQLDKKLRIAEELAEKAKARVLALDEELHEKSLENEAQEKELIDLRSRRTALERDLQRAGELAERHERSAKDLNEQLGLLDAIKADSEKLSLGLAQTTEDKAAALQQIAELENSLSQAEATRKQLTKELNDSRSQLDSTSKERENYYSDALKSWEKVEEIETERGELSREREALRVANETNAKRIDELETIRAALESERKDQASTLENLNGQVAALEAQREHLHEELEKLRADSGHTVTELREQLETIDRDRLGLSEEIAALKRVEDERDRLIARVEELEGDATISRRAQKQIESKLEEHQKQVERLDIEKSALEMRVEVLAENEQSLAREKNDQVGQAQAELQRTQAQLSEREATLQSKQEELEALLSSEQAKAEAALEEVRRELARATEEKQKIQSELTSVRDDEAVRDELLSTSEQEQQDLRGQLEQLTGDRQRLSDDLEKVRGELEQSSSRKADAESRITELEESLRALREGELSEAQESIEAITRERSELTEALEAAQQRHSLEMIDLQDRLALAQQEKEQMSLVLQEKDELLQSAEHDLTALEFDDDMDDDDLALEIDRSGSGEPEEPSLSADAVEEEDCEEIVLLDLEPFISSAVELLSQRGHRVMSLKPEPDSATELAQASFACAAINLATPAAWPTLRKIRNGAGVPHTPMVAYALGENAEKGFWLGPVDFVTLPIADTNMRDLISMMVPNVRRVIAMSHDFDVMEEVRAQLTESRISTAVVFDGRQVLDLVPTVKPQAAILHMSPNCTDVFRAVAGLRSQEETRNIPILFLLDQEAQPREESFVTAGIRMLSGRGTLLPDNLPDSLATALDGFQNAAE